MIQATGDIGTQWILDLCNGIVKEGCIPEDWKSSVQGAAKPPAPYKNLIIFRII